MVHGAAYTHEFEYTHACLHVCLGRPDLCTPQGKSPSRDRPKFWLESEGPNQVQSMAWGPDEVPGCWSFWVSPSWKGVGSGPIGLVQQGFSPLQLTALASNLREALGQLATVRRLVSMGPRAHTGPQGPKYNLLLHRTWTPALARPVLREAGQQMRAERVDVHV